MTEWGIFNDESSDYTEPEAIESGFYSQEEAEIAIRERYCEAEDGLHVHVIEEADEEEDEEDPEEDNME